MALTFPRTDIVEPFRFETQSFMLPPRQMVSTGSDGTAWGKDFGPELWTAQYATGDIAHDEAIALEAKLNSLRGVINRFEAGDGRRLYPKAHKDGDFGDTGQIDAIVDDTISLKGLNVGFTLSEGDYLAFTWGGGRRALHQVLETMIADDSGNMAAFTITPFPRPGWVADAAVTLKKPRGLFYLVPGSVSSTTTGPRSTVSFQARQFV